MMSVLIPEIKTWQTKKGVRRLGESFG